MSSRDYAKHLEHEIDKQLAHCTTISNVDIELLIEYVNAAEVAEGMRYYYFADAQRKLYKYLDSVCDCINPIK